jgi:hypothetical protein
MTRSLYILGTSHRFQVRTTKTVAAALDAFHSLVEGASNAYRVKLIAEEMSSEEITNRAAERSICEEVAHKLGRCHCYCDPNTAERAILGIVSKQDIISKVWLESPYGTSSEQDKIDAAPLVRASHQKREEEWLRRIEQCNQFPALFVCGACHVSAFAARATGAGLHCTVLQTDWQPG